MRLGRAWQNYPVGLFWAYVAIWVALSIDPADRGTWLLESVMVLLVVPLLVWSYYRFRLSNVSYTLVFLFLVLHTIGLHYTYAQAPIGFWLQDLFDLGRNHYDRVVHFSYGLLMSYPIREVFLRVAQTKGFWGYWFPIELTLAFSAIYEIIEMAAATLIDPSSGSAFLGTQGDEWDAQKDMAFAALGSVIAIAITAWWNWKYDHRFKREMRRSLRVKRKRPLGEIVFREMRKWR